METVGLSDSRGYCFEVDLPCRVLAVAPWPSSFALQVVDSTAVASKSSLDVRRSTHATTTTTTTTRHRATAPALVQSVQSGSERLRRLVREREMLVSEMDV